MEVVGPRGSLPEGDWGVGIKNDDKLVIYFLSVCVWRMCIGKTQEVKWGADIHT